MDKLERGERGNGKDVEMSHGTHTHIHAGVYAPRGVCVCGSSDGEFLIFSKHIAPSKQQLTTTTKTQ